MITILPFLFFLLAIGILLLGYPVAFSLAGVSILFSTICYFFGIFDMGFFELIPQRLYGIMINDTLIAIPLFIFMGVMLEKSKISENLLETMGLLFGRLRGGLGISICLVGALLAASTGIVGATVVTMGLLSLPIMLKYKYNPALASGLICASGSLGQIIPPSIVLIILGDIMSTANQQAQLLSGNFSPTAISVGDLFIGALFPGLFLVVVYILLIIIIAIFVPSYAPSVVTKDSVRIKPGALFMKVIFVLLPPLFLILAVLGTILAGYSTPTEAASVGSVGAMVLAFLNKTLTIKVLKEVVRATTKINCMVFIILIGSNFFSLVFRGLHGDDIISEFLLSMSGGPNVAFLIVMLTIFFLGFFLDFFEICFIVVPIIAPILIQMGFDPIWLGVIIAMNLQTSFLTPPFGFALFYLRGVAPDEIKTSDIYRGVIPFIIIQIVVIFFLWEYPEIITWLPNKVFNN